MNQPFIKVTSIASMLTISFTSNRTPYETKWGGERGADRIEDKCTSAAHIVARAAYLGVSQPGMERGKSSETIVIEAVGRLQAGNIYNLQICLQCRLLNSRIIHIENTKSRPLSCDLAGYFESNVISRHKHCHWW